MESKLLFVIAVGMIALWFPAMLLFDTFNLRGGRKKKQEGRQQDTLPPNRQLPQKPGGFVQTTEAFNNGLSYSPDCSHCDHEGYAAGKAEWQALHAQGAFEDTPTREENGGMSYSPTCKHCNPKYWWFEKEKAYAK